MGIPAALAQTPSFIPDGGVPGCDFASGDLVASCVPLFIAHVIKTVFGFVGGVCLILILIAGYRLLLAVVTGGDKSTGFEMLRWAIIGFVTSALTFFIIDFIISTLAGV
ncbi:MAG TPA: hypothetical protein DEB30_03195 [Candidatus Peribacter riflensis]|uniref:Uncharacterized protein n=1 Tax=Candidatus Peribacter riflensis TaxID=1735162 RepID=A0A0S1SF93_9BACT|nr:MAG: hypothetical protein PeribacterA2_0652 [Candidatus Peribacter riflensis]OGJ78978.1 MAG: hypothetical protein A2398_04730 [Candidatus Peribacteria bacterium RIFOXYB1_FULL_57_12]ALM11122.1 MAG: hypothetical protein PeribacterB2_0652 [Candidatus Peribacter riflensis]ALM12225.1 MAG: hypothetical protein PeribacterC2_0652 [Candidatus Peribacter riflensis]ALM13327.1 MAG: hypothetical protein PeribacterD1_0652 [Candidatus Peribacter riflensis]